MLSYLIFCHKKGEDASYSLIGEEEGFFVLPPFLSGITSDEAQDYEGSWAINNSDVLIKEDLGTLLKIVSNEIKFLKSVPKKPGNAGQIAAKLDAYKQSHELSLEQELLLQKTVLAIFNELSATSPYIIIDLIQCDQAPLLLDALKYCFPKEDLLFLLPENLKFALPSLGKKKEKKIEFSEFSPLTIEEAYRNFFDDIVDIKPLDEKEPTRIKKAKEKEPIVEKRKEEKAPKPKRIRKKEQGIAKKDVKPEDLKNANWNVFFFFLFALFELLVPYLYYLFLDDTKQIYFIIYVLFDAFFAIMAILSICYIREAKGRLTKKYVSIATFVSPLVLLIGVLLFASVSKAKGWTGYPFWTFLGIGFASFVLFIPLLRLYETFYLPRKAKKKGEDKK